MVNKLIFVALAWLFLGVPAVAQDGFSRLTNLEFDSLSGFSLGDGINYEKLYTPAGNCTKIADALITDDTPGAISVKAKIEVLSSADEIEKSTNTSLITTLGANAGMKGVFSADVTSTNTSTYEWFLNQKSSALIVRIKVYADYGRSVLDYDLKQNYKDLLATGSPKYQEFMDICGTHFIRAVQKEASIIIDMKVSQLSKDEKQTIVNNSNTSLKGSGTFNNGLTVGGNYSVDSKLKEFERFASQFGNVSIEMYGRGAPGFDGIEKIIYLEDGTSASIQEYLKRLGELVEKFKTTDGAPTTFILQKYPNLPDDQVNFPRILQLDKILRVYAHYKGFRDYYDEMKNSQYKLWNNHFQSEQAAVSATIDTLEKRYNACRDQDKCTLSLPKLIEHKTHEDLLSTNSLKGSCSNYLGAFDAGNSVYAMSDVAIVWRGLVNFPNYVDLNSVRAFQIYPNGYKKEFSANSFRPVRDFSVDPAYLESIENPTAKGPGRAISQLVNVKFPAENILDNGQIKPDVLRKIRNEYANSVFGLSFQFIGGPRISQMTGKPDMSNCQIARPQ